MSKQKIYLMKNEIGLYKIGISNNPHKRAKDIANNSGIPTDLVKQWDSYNAYVTEQKLHKLFENKRKKGEWFKLQKKDLVALEDIIPRLDKLIDHRSDMNPGKDCVRPVCQNLLGILMFSIRKLSLESIEDFINLRDCQYILLNKLYRNDVDGYFQLMDDLQNFGLCVPYVWRCGTKGYGYELYKPTLSYLQRNYPVCFEEDKLLLDILYTRSYLEDIRATESQLNKQLDDEIFKYESARKLKCSTN